MSRKWSVLMIVALLYVIWVYGFKPSTNLADLAASSPSHEHIQQFGEYRVIELQDYDGEFRILGREDYRFGREAELSPVDFAVGWGKMAEPTIYQQINIRQGNRWYYWRTEGAAPIPLREIETHSANIHIIPANASIAKQLKQVKTQDLIYLRGALVEIQADDGWRWRSSLSREDTGSGACELMRVDEIRFL